MAVGGTRDRWIEAWIEGEASASTGLFLWFMLEPRNRWGLSNFAQTRARSRRVIFQKRSSNARSISRNIHPHQPSKIAQARIVWFLDSLGTYGQHVHPKSEVRGHPTHYPHSAPPPFLPPSSPPALFLFSRACIFKCLWGPGIDSKEWIPPGVAKIRQPSKYRIILFKNLCN